MSNDAAYPPPPGAAASPPPPPSPPSAAPTAGGAPTVWPGNAAATTGLDPKVGGLLSYLLFGWVGGLIMYLTQSDREVRFHGAQSVLVFGTISVVQIVISVLSGVLGFGGFALLSLLGLVLALASFALWIYLSIQGYNLNHVRVPVAGEIAERWAAK